MGITMPPRTAERQQRLFESVSLPRAIAILAIPTIISQMVAVLYNLADTWFIGLSSDPDQVAALTLVFPIMLAFSSFGNLFAVGGSSLVSRQLGSRENAEAGRTYTWTVYVAAAVSLVLSLVVWLTSPTLLRLLGATPATYGYAFQYTMWVVVAAELPSVLNTTLCNLVRSQGNPNQASFGIILGCVLNVGLDPLFILGLDMGVVGAAISTCISQYLGLAYLLWHVVRTRKTSLAPVPLRFSPIPRSSISEILKIGTPAMLQVLLSSVSNAVILSLVAGYDPSAAVAGLGIAQRIEMIPFALAMGISSGVLPLIGFNYAAENFARMRNAIRISLMTGLVLALIAFALLEAFAAQSVQFFLNDAQSIAYGSAFVRLRIIALPFITVEFMLMAVFQAIGSARQAFVLSIFRKGTVDIPFMFAMNVIWPLYGLMIVQPTMEFLGCTIALVMYRRMARRLRSEGTQGDLGPADMTLTLRESD
jgi:multidrug efflux pump